MIIKILEGRTSFVRISFYLCTQIDATTTYGQERRWRLKIKTMINYIFKAVTFTTALLSLYNEVRRTGIFEKGKEYEKCKPVRGFTA